MINIWQQLYKYRYQILLGLALVFLVFPLLLAFNILPGLAPEKISLATVSYSKVPAGSGLTASLEAPPARFRLSESPVLEVVLTNSGGEPVALKELSSSGCLQLAIALPQPAVIPAHQSIRQSGAIRVTCEPGQYPLKLSFAWEEGAAQAAYKGFAATSPILLASAAGEAMPRFFGIVSGLLRNFWWPVVVALLGFWIQDQLTRRDNILKDDQDARDSRGRILNTVLPDYSKLVQEHYLAIGRRIDTAELEGRGYLETLEAALAVGQAPAVPPERALCAILVMRKQILKLLAEKGGIYFVSSVAEDLLAEASLAFMAQCYSVVGKDDFGEAIELLLVEDTFTAALTKCRNAALFTGRLLPRFRVWVDANPIEFRAYLQLLKIMSIVVVFECNRPFYQVGPVDLTAAAPTRRYNWYVDPPQLKIEADVYQVPVGMRKTIHELLKGWLNGIPPECRQDVAPVP